MRPSKSEMDETMHFGDYYKKIRQARPALWSSHPLNSSDRYQPFFIIGSGRNGSTLLRRMLIANPTIHIPPETYVLHSVIKRFNAHKRASWSLLVDLTLATFEYHPEFERFGVSLRPLAAEQKQVDVKDQNLAQLLNSIYRFHAQQTGHNPLRWGDKTPINTFHLADIYGVFPDAKFIHILRDGRDCVASMLTRLNNYTLETASDRWSQSVRAADEFAKKHPSACHLVRYEDLTQDPEDTLERVCAFLQVDYAPDMVHSEQLAHSMGDVPALAHHENVAKKVFSASVGRARQIFDADQMDAVTARLQTQLRKFGYL